MPTLPDRRTGFFARPLLCAMALGMAPGVAGASHEDIAAVISFLENYAPNVEFPAVGAVFDDSATDGLWLCSAALISPRWLLTAGHCVHSDGGPLNLKVFLQAEKPLPVETTIDYCQEQDELAVSICTARDGDTIALVKLAEPAEVWPWLPRGTVELPKQLALVGFGRTSHAPEKVGTGIKLHRSVPIKACDVGGPKVEVCQTDGGLPCIGYSGSPLLADDADALAWEQVGVARTAGADCMTGTARYPDVSVDAFKGWINNRTAAGNNEVDGRREIRGWGRVQFGRFDRNGGSTDRTVEPVVVVPVAPDGESWPAPGEWINQRNTVEVTDEPKVDLLRFTMNHEEFSFKSECTNGLHACRNEFKLNVEPPPSCVEGCECECSRAKVFTHCDCKTPMPGLWTFEVKHVRGAGIYQLLALPLGPLQTVAPDTSGLPPAGHGDAPRIASRRTLGPDVRSTGEIVAPGAAPRMIVTGARLSSAPIIRVNVDDNGYPSTWLMDMIRQDIQGEIGILRSETHDIVRPPMGEDITRPGRQ